MRDSHETARPALNPDDALALDALVEAGFDTANIDPALRARAERAAALLGLLEPIDEIDAGARALMADVTMARVLRAAAKLHERAREPALCADDSRALDALAGDAWDDARAPTPLRDRAARLVSLLRPVRESTERIEIDPAQRDALISATLGRVQAEIDRAESWRRLRTEPATMQIARGGFRLRDLVSVAAMALIAFGVFLPMASAWREQARITQCASNLSNAGVGFAMYANERAGSLPAITAGFNGATWWNVGEPRQSHSANLFTLAREGYASLRELSCPGNAAATTNVDDPENRLDWSSPDEVSYSYQLPPSARLAWSGPARIVVLADKSPIIDRARRNEVFDPEARSINHRGMGQNVLYNDGSVVFLNRPVIVRGFREDNIWLPRSVERMIEQGSRPLLRGAETPADEEDAFVAP